MRYFLSLFLFSVSFSANAITPKDLNDLYSVRFANDGAIQLGAQARPLALNFSVSDTYRIGDEWGKQPYSTKDASDPEVSKMAQATARVGGATGFYLGFFGGRHVMATNYHVCESESDCLGTLVRFTVLNRAYSVSRFYGSWSDVDLALFAIDVPTQEDAAILASVASPFDFQNELYRGQELVTIGYGVGSNPGRQLVVNQDSDCVVFSDAKEFRYMGDPDDLNPGPYKAWSFANGCDVSHGDSGSAMMDRQTGHVVGIIWTGKIPKSAKVQDSQFLKDLLKTPTEDVWKELSYAVPAFKIGEYLTDLSQSGTLAPDFQAVLEDMM